MNALLIPSEDLIEKMRRQARAELGVALPDLLLLDSKPHAVAGVVYLIDICPDGAWAFWWYGGRVGRWTDPDRPLPVWAQRDCANEFADFQQAAPMMAAQSLHAPQPHVIEVVPQSDQGPATAAPQETAEVIGDGSLEAGKASEAVVSEPVQAHLAPSDQGGRLCSRCCRR